MKKAGIVFLILIVLGIVGYFVYTEISVKELTYVSTVEKNDEHGRYAVKRLYSSDIDIEAFNKKIEDLMLVEFSEEDILAAALEAGTPEFFPAMHVRTYRSDDEENTVYMDLMTVQELAKGQKNTDYSMTNIKLEIMTTGVSIVEAEAVGTDSLNRAVDESILKNEEGTAMVVELNDYGTANLKLNGTTGTVVLQYTYDIKKNSLLPATALTGCLTQIRVNIITNAEDQTEISYTVDPATTIDEYIEQE